MENTTFDRIAKLFAARRNRQAAIAGGMGLAAGITSSAASRTTAQEATPAAGSGAVDPHPSADAPKKVTYLFAQPFAGGSWAPKPGEAGLFTLTLTGAAAQTVYYSDRPERIFGLTPTQQFLDGLGFTPDTPPSAALVASTEGGQDVLIIELFNPNYDETTGTLIYDAKILADYEGESLKVAAQLQDDFTFPETFGAGGLFIDDCMAVCGRCIIPGERNVGYIQIPTCYVNGVCDACDPDFTSAEYGRACAEKYPDVCKYDESGWNCQVVVQRLGLCT
ncbi:MAG TPA: hypothetical protein VIL01_04965 [Thermomicrobiales bacterium]